MGRFPLIRKMSATSSKEVETRDKPGRAQSQGTEGLGNRVMESQTQRNCFMRARLNRFAHMVVSLQVRSRQRDSGVEIKLQAQNDCSPQILATALLCTSHVSCHVWAAAL